MKKYQAGGGIREGKARFGDDVRERARKAMAERDKKGAAEAIPVKLGKPIPARSLDSAKPKAKPAAKKTAPKKTPAPRTNVMQDRTDREPPVRSKYGSSVPSQPASQRSGAPRPPAKPATPPKKSTQMGPQMTFPRDVGTDKAAEARRKMFEGNSPLTDLMEAMRGKKGTGGQMSRMKSGGKVKKGFRK